MTCLYKPVYYSHSLHPGGNTLTHSLAVVDTISAVTDAFYGGKTRSQCKNSKEMRISHLAFTPTRGSRTGIIRGHGYQWRASAWCRHSTSRDDDRGELRGGCFSIIPPANGSRLSTSPWNSLSTTCQSAFLFFCFFSSLFPFAQSGGSLTNQDVQLRASRKESCLMEFKVGKNCNSGIT